MIPEDINKTAWEVWARARKEVMCADQVAILAAALMEEREDKMNTPKATKEMALAFYAEIDRQRAIHGWPAHDIKFETLPEVEQQAILASFDAALSVSPNKPDLEREVAILLAQWETSEELASEFARRLIDLIVSRIGEDKTPPNPQTP